MHYYVNDLYNDTCVKSGSITDVAYWWRRKVGQDFTQLNITGNDTFSSFEKDGWLRIKGGIIPTWKRVSYLRRYQVLDEDGRSIDIRNWPKSVWEWAPTYPPYHWPCGFKDNHHRTTGPSMWRGTYRAAMDVFDVDELLQEGLPLPIRDNTDVRLPFGGTDDVWGYYDSHYCHWRSKSWKDQTKARKQWAKYKQNGEKFKSKWARYDQELKMRMAEDPDYLEEVSA